LRSASTRAGLWFAYPVQRPVVEPVLAVIGKFIVRDPHQVAGTKSYASR
jgi:hypothetical protein